MVEWYVLYGTLGAIAVIVYLGGRVALMALDDINDLVYGEETMNLVLDYPSKKEEGY